MTPEQYLDTHQAEAYAEIADAMGLQVCGYAIYGDNKYPITIENECVDFIYNVGQRWGLAVFLFRKTYTGKSLQDGVALCAAMSSDNPPRQLVLAAMDMLGIGKPTSRTSSASERPE